MEGIVRKKSGDATFALPYWNYIVNQTDTRVLPYEFRVAHSLLTPRTKIPDLNGGAEIGDERFIGNQEGVKRALGSTDFFSFSNNLESNPHDVMHDYIGGVNTYNPILQKYPDGTLTRTDTAGFDPIFFLHHGMIDYLFWKWDTTSKYSQRPCLEVLKKNSWPYHFINPDGTHESYNYKEVLYHVYNPDYTYQGLPKESGSQHRPCYNGQEITLVRMIFNYTTNGTNEHIFNFFGDDAEEIREAYNPKDTLHMIVYVIPDEGIDKRGSITAYIRYSKTGNQNEAHIGSLHDFFHKDVEEKTFFFDITVEYKDSDGEFQIVLKSDRSDDKFRIPYIDVKSMVSSKSIHKQECH